MNVEKPTDLPKLLFGEVVEVNFIFKTSGVRQFVASDVDRTCILLKNVSFVIFFLVFWTWIFIFYLIYFFFFKCIIYFFIMQHDGYQNIALNN